MDTLFPTAKNTDLMPIGKGFSLKKIGDDRIEFYQFDKLQKVVPLKPKIEFRLFVIDLARFYALKKNKIAEALGISRQSIDNWLDIYHQYGVSGLENSPRTPTGNKARELELQRKEEREELERKEFHFNFSFDLQGDEKQIDQGESPFQREHTWQKSRYAGIFVHQITLMSVWQWFKFTIGYFGEGYKLFQVFLLMVCRNIGSVEQTKHIRKDEARVILGLTQFPGKDKLWEWFYQATGECLSPRLLKDFFRFQILRGIVNLWFWFIDGHRLGYTGKKKVHHTYNTQRQMPEPGRTNMVVCDVQGNVVDFEIQEGKGDLKSFVLNLDDRWEDEIEEKPVKVFDREGDGIGFFSSMVRKGNPFVTWEKNSDSKKLNAMSADLFSISFELNGKEYGVFEDEKKYTFEYETGEKTGEKQVHKFSLRRIYLWNKSTGKRTSGLAYTPHHELSTQDCAFAILSRWGASENTFKHIQTRHPYNYQPGYLFRESDNQSIANPSIKDKQKQIKRLKTEINKLYKQMGTAKEGLTKEGTPRQNSIKERLKTEIRENELMIKRLLQEVKSLPERIELSSLDGNKSFKVIDNEGKKLFDFVTSAVWNSRKQVIEWLQPYYANKNEIVDLFYAITQCQGWIKTTRTSVTVRIEPLQQASRRAAQEQLCRKLTSLAVQTPTGKFMIIEVGDSPI
jgi:transposase